MALSTLDRWVVVRHNAYLWRYELGLVKKITLAVGVACIVGLLAQVRFPIPWSPVPISGQTFAVLLAAVLLGKWWGGISLAIYAGLGAVGVPWFSNWASGVGATWGYIIGFILAALFLGHVTDKYIRARSFFDMLSLMLLANFVLIYIPGLLWLWWWLNLGQGTTVSFITLLGIGALPFVAGDVIKAMAAAGIACRLMPKQSLS